MPDLRGRVEGDLPAEVDDLPAEVDVVAGGRVHRVEAAHLVEDFSPEGHVAARQVFGPVVADEDVDWTARCTRHHLGAGRIIGRWEVWSAHSADLSVVH